VVAEVELFITLVDLVLLQELQVLLADQVEEELEMILAFLLNLVELEILPQQIHPKEMLEELELLVKIEVEVVEVPMRLEQLVALEQNLMVELENLTRYQDLM
tara:strand:+ start:148 stop:456 length:309 start_codon:yes stop_codon:yes gene_type:complete